MDLPARFRHSEAMRTVMLAAILILAGCSGDPRSYGITGPGQQPAPTPGVSSGALPADPGVPTTGTYYGPSVTPMQGSSGFWGYNN